MTPNKISFSVIIPVFNGANTIEETIESCILQTELPLEIIVVDDASTDNTESVVKSKNSSLVIYIRNERNRGPSYSRNLGIQKAKGSWILFLDADDCFNKKKIEIIHHCLNKNNSIRAIGHAFQLSTDNTSINTNWIENMPKLKLFSGNNILWRNPMVTPSLAVAASNGIFFNEKMFYAEDHDFILRTAEKFGIYYLEIPLCSLQRFPLTPGGISSNKWKMRNGEMKMYINYCKRHRNFLAIPFLLLLSNKIRF